MSLGRSKLVLRAPEKLGEVPVVAFLILEPGVQGTISECRRCLTSKARAGLGNDAIVDVIGCLRTRMAGFLFFTRFELNT